MARIKRKARTALRPVDRGGSPANKTTRTTPALRWSSVDSTPPSRTRSAPLSRSPIAERRSTSSSLDSEPWALERHRFRDKEFSHTPLADERLDWQYGPSLKIDSAITTFYEVGPAVSEEDAANVIPSIESNNEECEIGEKTKKDEESDDEDEGYRSETESESEDEWEDAEDLHYYPKDHGDFCREKGDHKMVLTRGR